MAKKRKIDSYIATSPKFSQRDFILDLNQGPTISQDSLGDEDFAGKRYCCKLSEE